MLRVPIRISLDLVPKFILATAILHNVGKHLNDTYDANSDFEDDDGGEDSDNEDGYQPTNTTGSTSQAAIRRDGQARRDAVAALLTSTRTVSSRTLIKSPRWDVNN